MNPGDTEIAPADTTDLAAFAAECDQFAAGLQQQAIAAQSGTAMGGHPNPSFFNGRAASLLKAAADLLRPAPKPSDGPAGDPAAPPVPPPNPPEPAPTPKPVQAEQPAKKK